ncbi:MAG: adenylate/guanylate cyclase domain-containing protein, partial [Terriglobales bacterium]
VTQIIQSSRAQAELLAELEKFRRNLTVMFTDIKGSTAYFEKYGDVAGLMMVSQCNDALRQIVESHGGRVVKTIGDAIMATFEDGVESIHAAIRMQKALIKFNEPKPVQDHVFIRIGLNYGPGIVKSNDVFGDVVNVASRVESVAVPQQIVISDSLNQQVASSGKFKISHLGRFALKGKEENRDLFEVVWNEGAAPIVAAAHTVVTGGAKFSLVVPKFKLLHIKRDGSVGAEHELKKGKLSVGRNQGDVTFEADQTMAPAHARFSVERGQLFVEDISAGQGVFVRLIATYTLVNEDVILTGRQMFQFREKSEALAAAAATGTTVLNMAAILNESVAELIRMTPQGPDASARFPLNEEEVILGRNRGTYVFPDDGFMSGSHAKIYQRGENFFLEDTGSRNGTFVKVRDKAPVPVGAVVLAGGQLLKAAQE